LNQAAKSTRFLADGSRVIIQCDSAIDFRVLKKVMYTCGKAQFSDFSLLVKEDLS
jgi:biopolymer transport protein ExbD